MRLTKVQSLLNRFKSTDLAKSIGTDVNKIELKTIYSPEQFEPMQNTHT